VWLLAQFKIQLFCLFGGGMYQGFFEEPLVTPEPPPAGAAVPALVPAVVGLEPVAVVAVFEVPFEHNPRNQDWIPDKPFGSFGQAAGQTPVAEV
jgi:hypothetical protein